MILTSGWSVVLVLVVAVVSVKIAGDCPVLARTVLGSSDVGDAVKIRTNEIVISQRHFVSKVNNDDLSS